MRSDLAEALRRWRGTVALLAGVEETPEALRVGVQARIRLLQFGARAGMERGETERLEAEGRPLAERLGDPGMSGFMVVVSGSARYVSGDLEGALARWLEAARQGEAARDPDVRVALMLGATVGFTYVGPLSEGLAWCDRGLQVCAGNPELGFGLVGFSVLPRIHQFRAGHLVRMGRLVEAAADVQHALAMLRPRAEPESLCWTLAMLPLLAWLSGDQSDTSAAAHEAVRVAEEAADVASLVLALEASALTHLMAGRPADATAACERALAVAHEMRSGLHVEASVLAHLARARLAAGDPAGARAAADQAVDVSRRQGARVLECLALLTRAQVAAAGAGSLEPIGEDLNAALTLAGDTGALIYEPFIREELGRLRGDEAELREAIRLYTAIGATGHARRLAAELAGSVPPASAIPSKGALLE
jgi:tetratricopeptide (TPR) repeat protein